MTPYSIDKCRGRCYHIDPRKKVSEDDMRIGYVRVSTIEQNEARQMELMSVNKAEKIFMDKASGKSVEGRQAFCEMIDFVRSGDSKIGNICTKICTKPILPRFWSRKSKNRALSIRARKASKHEKNGEKQRKTEILRSPFFGLSDWT